MSKNRANQLYNLLPALYRTVDENEGGPLRALLDVMQAELEKLEGDLLAQYDNWFIETCDRWVIPYIADLVGVRGLNDPQQLSNGQRRRVANAFRYQRRKGTPGVLEQVLQDVSGCAVHGTEYYRHLAMTQHLAHLRPDAGQTFDMRDQRAQAAVGTPFDNSARSADVRGISTTGRGQQAGRYNRKNVGLFLWRLRPYPIVNSPARRVWNHKGPPFYFTFDPLGRDMQLFNKPLPVPDGIYPATIESLPLPLTRKMLAADLAAYTRRWGEEQSGSSAFYGPDRGLVIQYVWQDGSGHLQRHVVPPEALLSLPLWEGLDGLKIPEGKSVAIDVERGRFAFLGDDRSIAHVTPMVNYTYGFSDDIGGGPYERTPPLRLDEVEVLHVYVAEGCASEAIDQVMKRWETPGPWQVQARTLAQAFAIWENFYKARTKAVPGQASHPTAVIHILDNGLYGGCNGEADNDLTVRLGPGSRLSVIAADGVRPVIRTLHNLVFSCETVEPSSPENDTSEWQLHLNGLFVHSQIKVPHAPNSGKLSIDIDHCTLLPGGIAVERSLPASQRTRLSIRNSLVGPLMLASALEQLSISDSILDGLGGTAISVGGDCTAGETVFRRVTVLGPVDLQALTYAQDCLFTRPVTLKQAREGDAIRYCYLQDISPSDNTIFLEHRVGEKPGFKPVFTSTTFGDPAYGQLSLETPEEIFHGAANGSSLGAFCKLNEPQRFAGIQPILDEYLPLGLKTGLFFVT